jgi:hypothetical protein
MLLMGGKRLHVLISRFAPSLAAQTHPPCRLLVSLVRFSGTSGAGIATGDEINLDHELEPAESDPARKFMRGDSRETKHSDLYSIESHLYSRGSGGS